jgi:hypothetical protein
MHVKEWDKYWRLILLVGWNIYCKDKIKCLCECWIIKYIKLWHIRSWDIISCGCYSSEKAKERIKSIRPWLKHWLSRSRIYKIFWLIKERCNNTNSTSYHHYWWRWIKCEWGSFEYFYKDMSEWYSDTLEIDRVDNNWNYCKSNCRWATRKEQMRNRRTNHLYKWKCITQWCEELDINPSTVFGRINRLWWTYEKALELTK